MSIRVENDGQSGPHMTVTVCRASEAPKIGPSTSTIEITEPMAAGEPADLDLVGRNYEETAQAFYRGQAEDIYAALAHALPGGTLDALLGVMALGQASILRVRRLDGAE